MRDDRAEQRLHRVVPEQRGEQHRYRRQCRHPGRVRAWHALGDQAVVERGRQRPRQACDDQGEEDADGQHHGRVLERGAHPGTHPATLPWQAVHDPGPVGRGEQPHAEPVEQQDQRELPVREVDRQRFEEQERGGRHDHAAGGEGARPVRSDSPPESGPAIRKPMVSGSMKIPAHSGVWLKL